MDETDIEIADTVMPEALSATQTLASTALTRGTRAQRDDVDWQPGDLLLDEYEVQKSLGAGGMGQVYLVRNQLSGQQFAVKSTRVDDAKTRRQFLRELRTWLDLREHPNLTACRFYRTIEGRVVIFAEYVPGGSLADWIESGRVADAATAIDLAIQIARGLRVAHEQGLIHRDVKPGNVLLTDDGEAKVTDFGLTGSVDATIAGLTPAYCSPEQAFRDQPIRTGSDVWSWAATVLQMFTGEICWPNGAMLGLHLTRIAEGATAIPIPDEIESLLGVCFSPSTDDRPEFTAIIGRLESIYAGVTGGAYGRADTVDEQTAATPHAPSAVSSWTSPAAWFDAETRKNDRRTTSAISDLELFEEALAQRRAEFAGERTPGLRAEIARLLVDKAKVHRHGGDFPGAHAALAEARELLGDGWPDVLAAILTVEGMVLIDDGAYSDAEVHLRQALELREELEGLSNRLELAEIRRQIARTLFFRRDFEVAAAEAEATLDSLGTLETEEAVDPVTIRKMRARTLFTLATSQSKSDTETARKTLRQAVGLGEDLVVLDGCHDFREDLAKAYFNLAVCDRKLGDVQDAIETYQRVCRLQEQLVTSEERDDLVDDLAMTHSNLSFAHRFADQLDEARRHADRAIGLRERLVHLKGRRDLRDRLAASYVARAYVASEAEQWDEAVEYGQLAARLREHLVHEEERVDLERRLGGLYGMMGVWRENEGRLEEAAALYRRANEIREARYRRGDAVRLDMLVEAYLRIAECSDDDSAVDRAIERAREVLAENPETELSDEASALAARLLG
jgi:tetratricopeptide (TPR) repeat protein